SKLCYPPVIVKRRPEDVQGLFVSAGIQFQTEYLPAGQVAGAPGFQAVHQSDEARGGGYSRKFGQQQAVRTCGNACKFIIARVIESVAAFVEVLAEAEDGIRKKGVIRPRCQAVRRVTIFQRHFPDERIMIPAAVESELAAVADESPKGFSNAVGTRTIEPEKFAGPCCVEFTDQAGITQRRELLTGGMDRDKKQGQQRRFSHRLVSRLVPAVRPKVKQAVQRASAYQACQQKYGGDYPKHIGHPACNDMLQEKIDDDGCADDADGPVDFSHV